MQGTTIRKKWRCSV